VLLAADRPLAATLRTFGATVEFESGLEMLPRSLSPVRQFQHFRRARIAARRARQIASRDGVRVVHVVHESMWSLLSGLGGAGLARIVSVHGLRFTSPAWAGWLNARLLHATSDRIICVSDVVRQAFLQRGLPDQHLALVPSSVDLSKFHAGVSGHEFRQSINVPDDALLVATVGSVDERKGNIYFIEACGLLKSSHPHLRFAIVGVPPAGQETAAARYFEQLQARSHSLNLDDRLSFVPMRTDVPNIMAGIDLLAQPSLTEAGPRAPLEAMAMAKPVVGTTIEGTREEVVDGATGVLVEPCDPVALANAIAMLADDCELRARMGRAGRVRVENSYSLDSTATLIEQLYNEVGRAPR
jgi:glycosyltransferase involved in cell wall biosynthesis